MPYFPDRSVGLAQQRGFSLIEAMFSALILAIALLGLAGFQAVAMKDGSLIKARSVAANLAQEKLDDLRGFIRIADDPAVDEDGDGNLTNDCGDGHFCFSEIDDSSTTNINVGGGQENGNELLLPSGAVSGYLDGYSIAWAVTCSTESAGSALSFGATCTDAAAKLATVTVSWTDSQGNPQTVSLQGAIYAMDPARMAGGLARSFSSARPQASYTPIGVPDAVPVPINTGTGEYKESSKPVPEVVSNDTGAEVSFDAVSYSSNGSGGYDTTAKEEFVTTSCECEFDGSGTGYAPSRMVWNGTGLEAKIGDEISKPVGTAANGQSDLCNACCKDHHDIDDDQPKYDPDRLDSEYTGGGDHKHYWYTLCTSGTTGSTSGCNSAKKDLAASGNGYSEVSAGAYLESCRFKRVDGIWRLWQDWRQVKMTIIPYDYLQTDANLNAYVGVIETVVENTIRTDSGNGSASIPTLSNRDIAFTAEGEVKQLLGRAVYVDRIYEADNPANLDEVYYDNLVALIGADSDWLNIVPFYEANLTLLIDWSTSNATKATVTSQTIVDINDVGSGYYNSYSRGKVTAISSGSATITATARLHNTGVTGGINTASPSHGISSYDNTGPLSDSISVSVPGSPSSAGISGKFVRANASVNFSTLQITGTTCTLQTAIGNELPYTCTVASGASPTLTYSSTVGSTYTFSPASESFSNVTSAVTAQTVTVYGPKVQISGSLAEAGNPNLSKVNVSAVPASGTTTACTVSTGAKTYTCLLDRGTTGFTGTLVFSDTDNSSVYTFSPVSPHAYTNQQADIVANVTVTKP